VQIVGDPSIKRSGNNQVLFVSFLPSPGGVGEDEFGGCGPGSPGSGVSVFAFMGILGMRNDNTIRTDIGLDPFSSYYMY
jgi:hypothetical protein